MRVVVLLSDGIDPISGRAAPVPSEVAAISLAHSLNATLSGLHVGKADASLRMAAGYGLSEIDCLTEARDVLNALANHWAAAPPDVVLTGRRGIGGDDTGLLPYLLAEHLGWPILADILSVGTGQETGWLHVVQALPQGAWREGEIECPCILTASESTPPPAFVFDRARRAVLRCLPSATPQFENVMPPVGTFERPYRRRPRLIGETVPVTIGQMLVDSEPEEAARALLAHLRGLGVLPDTFLNNE